MNQLSDETRAAIAACLECHQLCHAMLMTHCIETGGAHVRPQHVRLMTDCAAMCRLTADAMARKSQFHRQLCALCAEVCEACADSCDALDGMAACAKTCRLCAQACRHMA
jgi:hypothetical protein